MHNILVCFVKLFAASILWVLCARVVSWIYKRRWEQKLGAQPVRNTERNGLFGIRFGIRLLGRKRAGTLTEFHRTRYLQLEDPNVGLFLFTVFGKKMVLTRDPENIKAMLAIQFDEFDLGNRRKLLYDFLGDGIFCANGESWSHSRALLRPQFTRDQVGRLESLEPYVQLLAQNVRRQQGRPFDMQELFYRFTVDSTTSFLFGESAGALEGIERENLANNRDFSKAFDVLLEIFAIRVMLQGMRFLCRSPDYEHSIDVVNSFTDYYIKKALALLNEELEKAQEKGYVFLYSICRETRDPKVIRDEIMSILAAGRDTTASLLSFTLYELARNPNMWNALREEVESYFGSGTDSMTFESLKQCQLLRAILNELLRMYPPVPSNSRTVRRTTTLPRGGGPDGLAPILVERGQTVTYSVYAMHRNPAIYGGDAQTFDPSRWYDGRTKGIGWEFLPFNGGPRMCLGQQYALTEASYVLVRLAQMFPRLSLANPDAQYPPQITSNLSINLMGGLNVCMHSD